MATYMCVCACAPLTSDRQSGAPRHKLEEKSLLLGVEAAQHLEQEADGAAAKKKPKQNKKNKRVTTNEWLGEE